MNENKAYYTSKAVIGQQRSALHNPTHELTIQNIQSPKFTSSSIIISSSHQILLHLLMHWNRAFIQKNVAIIVASSQYIQGTQRAQKGEQIQTSTASWNTSISFPVVCFCTSKWPATSNKVIVVELSNSSQGTSILAILEMESSLEEWLDATENERINNDDKQWLIRGIPITIIHS